MKTLKKIGNYLTFRGNINSFVLLLLFTLNQIIYMSTFDLSGQLSQYFPNSIFALAAGDLFRDILFCYLYGIAIVARLRNMDLNPQIGYFFVVLMWLVHYVAVHMYSLPCYKRAEFYAVAVLLIAVPLLPRDKNALQFWHSEK
jgi:hypothetical protein